MSNRAKSDGTEWESHLVSMAHARGWKAWRISEGGQYDYGDVAIELPSGRTIVLEAKRRTQLNIHATNDKASAKVADNLERIPHEVTAVGTAWKRLVDRGGKRRVQAGKPIVAFDLDTTFALLDLIG